MDKKYKYRFKTKEEFISEFGQIWREDVKLQFPVFMDALLGTDINKKHYKDIDFIFKTKNRNKFISNTNIVSCNVSIDMIKRINLSPSLEPRKFVY